MTWRFKGTLWFVVPVAPLFLQLTLQKIQASPHIQHFFWFIQNKSHFESSDVLWFAALMMLLYFVCRVFMLVYLLYISIFTLCCINRPLKDIPENYTKADNDQTIKVQKSLTVWNIIIFMFLYIKALLYVCKNLMSFCMVRRAIRPTKITCV